MSRKTDNKNQSGTHKYSTADSQNKSKNNIPNVNIDANQRQSLSVTPKVAKVSNSITKQNNDNNLTDNHNRPQNIQTIPQPFKTTSQSIPTSNEEIISSKTTQTASPVAKLDRSIIDSITDKSWLDLQYHDTGHQHIKKPDEIQDSIPNPSDQIDSKILDKIQGSMIGLALGDALGAYVEFRPREYLVANPVPDLEGGGTWGLKKGQFTDDTSMALCLANSLVKCCDFDPYDQLVRYKWWYKYGYMSSTGQCFDIGAATRNSLVEFENRQRAGAKKLKMKPEDMDVPGTPEIRDKVDVYCSEKGVAGNGALMRLAPVPLFFYREPSMAVECSGISGEITHGDTKTYDACRYYGALIVAALRGENKDDILDKNFYSEHKEWFGGKPLCDEIRTIARGSFKRKGGYDEGIRGKGYIVSALEAALWAFWDDGDSFETGALKAVNLGDDTDTTAAIYGQLAGAYYGYSKLPEKWLKHVYARTFMEKLSKWVAYEGEQWRMRTFDLVSFHSSSKLSYNKTKMIKAMDKQDLLIDSLVTQTAVTTTESEACRTPKQSITLDLNQCLEWTVDEVCEWIKSFGDVYAVYENIFKHQNVNGYYLLHMVDRQVLLEFGIDSQFHRKVILHNIEELKKRCSSSMPSTNCSTKDFYSQFEGDYVPPLHVTELVYPNTKSCVLQPLTNDIHSKLYTQILNWLGPLPSHVDIDKIELIHNADLYRMFLQQMKNAESRQLQPAFQPNLDKEKNPDERKRVLDRLYNLAQQVHHTRSASVARVWHGCDRATVAKLLSNGFAALSKLDEGWFGTGMYFTSSAEYATKYTNSCGCLIMCYVVLLNPFPIIADDAPSNVPSTSFRFYGRGNYSNYQCHYVPVIPFDEGTSWNFRPPPKGVQDAVYDELVVFQQADILPQAVIHLKPKSSPTTAASSTNAS